MQRFDWGQDEEQQKERRMQERRQRVQDRMAADKQQSSQNGTSESGAVTLQQQAKGKLEAQRGLEAVQRLYKQCEESVTTFREQAERREEQRKEQWDQQEFCLKDEVASELEMSKEQNREIDLEWEAVQNAITHQQAFAAMTVVQQHCEQVLQSKDDQIRCIQVVLRERDEAYINLLQSQTEETDAFIGLMSQEYNRLKQGQEEALEAVKAAYLQERSELMSAHRAELNTLLDKRSGLEQAFMDQYLKACEAYQDQLEDMRLAEAKEQMALRRRLEKEVESLEAYLDSMRSVYILNADKLEYNVRVLSERERESKEIMQQQKRKITRQWEVLAKLKKRFAAMERKGREENLKLADEYQRVVRAFNCLQTQFRRIKAADLQRFDKVRAMKEEEFEELAAQLSHADGMLSQQLLKADSTQPHVPSSPAETPSLLVLGRAASSASEAAPDLGLSVVGRPLTTSLEAEAGVDARGDGGRQREALVEAEVLVLPNRDSSPAEPLQLQPQGQGQIAACLPEGIAAQWGEASCGESHQPQGRVSTWPATPKGVGESTEAPSGSASVGDAPSARADCGGTRTKSPSDSKLQPSECEGASLAGGLPAGMEPLAWQELRESMEVGVLSLLLGGSAAGTCPRGTGVDSTKLSQLLAKVPRSPGSELWEANSVARALGVRHPVTQHALERAFRGELDGSCDGGDGTGGENGRGRIPPPPDRSCIDEGGNGKEESAEDEQCEVQRGSLGQEVTSKGDAWGMARSRLDHVGGGVSGKQVEAGLQYLVTLLQGASTTGTSSTDSSRSRSEAANSSPCSPSQGGDGKGQDPTSACYWRQLVECAFPTQRFKTWAVLAPQVQRLLKLLQARSKAAEQVTALKAENEGLKARLREQLTSPHNDEMQLPTKILLQ